VPDLWSDLLGCLDLRPAPSKDAGEERAGHDVTDFEGRHQRLNYHRVIGGQLLGRFIRIACPGRHGTRLKGAFF
jgi:acyl-CoA thioesterase-2